MAEKKNRTKGFGLEKEKISIFKMDQVARKIFLNNLRDARIFTIYENKNSLTCPYMFCKTSLKKKLGVAFKMRSSRSLHDFLSQSYNAIKISTKFFIISHGVQVLRRIHQF